MSQNEIEKKTSEDTEKDNKDNQRHGMVSVLEELK